MDEIKTESMRCRPCRDSGKDSRFVCKWRQGLDSEWSCESCSASWRTIARDGGYTVVDSNDAIHHLDRKDDDGYELKL